MVGAKTLLFQKSAKTALKKFLSGSDQVVASPEELKTMYALLQEGSQNDPWAQATCKTVDHLGSVPSCFQDGALLFGFLGPASSGLTQEGALWTDVYDSMQPLALLNRGRVLVLKSYALLSQTDERFKQLKNRRTARSSLRRTPSSSSRTS